MKENKHWDDKDPPLNILINLSEIGTIIEIKKRKCKKLILRNLILLEKY